MSTTPTPKAKRGFAAMSPDRRREIAKMGGRSVPAHKRSFSTNKDLAKSAGSIGGKSVDGAKRSYSVDPALAAACGRKGGMSRVKALG